MQDPEPSFPKFPNAPEGGITAWSTMRLTDIAADKDTDEAGDLMLTLGGDVHKLQKFGDDQKFTLVKRGLDRMISGEQRYLLKCPSL